MATTRDRRIMKELADLQIDADHSGVTASLYDLSNFTHLRGALPGPPDTPYAGGTFIVDIKIPESYPFKPPTIKFETKIWHPNVSSVTVSRGRAGKSSGGWHGSDLTTRGWENFFCTFTDLARFLSVQGAICLDILGTGWSPVGTIKMALISIRMLLETPNPKDPQDAEVAKMMMEHPDDFALKAHDWAVMHAGAPRKEQPKHNYKMAPPPVVNTPARYAIGMGKPKAVESQGALTRWILTDIRDTTRSWSTDSSAWVLT